MTKEVENNISDPDYQYPAGFVNFEAICAGSLRVTIYWYGLDTSKTYTNRKYNITNSTYKQIGNLTQKIKTINDQKVLTFEYQIDDNDTLDEDNRVGFIKDPIGPALAVTNNSGGVIAINAQSSSATLLPSKIQNDIANSTIQSISNSITAPEEVLTQSDLNSTNLSTIRTGASEYDYILGLILIILGITILTQLPLHNQKSNLK